MCGRIFKGLLLLGALNVGTLLQAQPFRLIHMDSADVAVTYDMSVAKPVGSSGNFWMQGGGVDGAISLYRGVGLAGSFVGEHTSNIASNIGITKLSYTGGPRYTYELKGTEDKKRTSIFGECLFGVTHAYDSVFATSSGSVHSANAFTMQAGGGLDMELGKRIGIRLPEVHYVRSSLPNGGSNSQNDIRLSGGVSYRFKIR